MTALVLSGGGMYGAYQAGAWDALSKTFQPDLVVGASIGSLNGWLIASGLTGAELIERWRGLGNSPAPRWRIPRHPAEGLIDSTPLEQFLQEMFVERRPVTRYALVASKLPTLQPTVFEWPDLTWQHIASSCAVPFCLKHHRLDGAYYSDGGLLDPLPLDAAIRLGATRIVAINLLKYRPASIRWMVKGLRAYSRYAPASPQDVELIEIAPSARLGPIRDSLYWSKANTERWIELGRLDTLAALASRG